MGLKCWGPQGSQPPASAGNFMPWGKFDAQEIAALKAHDAVRINAIDVAAPSAVASARSLPDRDRALLPTKGSVLKMRAIILAAAMCCLSAGASLAGVSVPQAADLSRPAAEGPSKQSAFEAAILDCESMWDRGTHMTEQGLVADVPARAGTS